MSQAVITPLQTPAISVWKTRLWTSFHVAVCMVMLYLWMMGSSENHLYQSIVKKVVKPEMNREQAALALLETTHKLLVSRKFWPSEKDIGIRQRFLRSADVQLMIASDCGDFAHVLVKALQVANFRARFCQMLVGDMWGGHIVVEAEVEPDRWAVLGPLHGTSFKRPDGKLASFADVQGNWDKYKEQVPEGYLLRYDYQNVRYTNWDKIPVLMPMLRWVLSFFMSAEDLRTFCIRAYITNLYYTYAIILGVFYFLVLAVRFVIYRNRTRGQWPARAAMKYDVSLSDRHLNQRGSLRLSAFPQVWDQNSRTSHHEPARSAD